MMKSHDINLFLIPFQKICDLLDKHGIQFNWDEKDRKTAVASWRRFSRLREADRSEIGVEMINLIKKDLKTLVLNILDDRIEREIEKVMIELHSNLGEVKEYEFLSVEKAIAFLNASELQEIFLTTDSLTLFDPPPEFDVEM
jgi:hypothetical protein